jgi:hypothetical protein
MSDKELIARLHLPWPKEGNADEVTLPLWVLELTTEAADRIEELEGQLQSVLERETSILRYYDKKLDAADAKLAKAVKLMELSVELATWNTTLLEDVIDFITELKGE